MPAFSVHCHRSASLTQHVCSCWSCPFIRVQMGGPALLVICRCLPHLSTHRACSRSLAYSPPTVSTTTVAHLSVRHGKQISPTHSLVSNLSSGCRAADREPLLTTICVWTGVVPVGGFVPPPLHQAPAQGGLYMPSASHFAAPGLHPLFMVTGWHRLLDTCAHAHPAHSFACR
jgi:hypothetical protein